MSHIKYWIPFFKAMTGRCDKSATKIDEICEEWIMFFNPKYTIDEFCFVCRDCSLNHITLMARQQAGISRRYLGFLPKRYIRNYPNWWK
ncbi:hypothetical protein AUJ66_05305 [Candidatus Desantisbacteria bacterium CG1_02_38_46]|uniref:Uncharacterized protein n=3 Tax=unclassified Candidatus Desantisiibacteriota TaxID=3106372 RepID=A0A2H9PD47_9BACT|nr:MAG: hypothetical protein AUJ66_05305 [Candidatus Desantisbacteria bacterium CG1_02_38_46]PIU51763.1 MAG: hypothetical protein COS91_02775 [Candidatus Desantisbacteria bacterium CG07_land_8_20_14_0_80_39_15]PIZ17343.1 MAG: hypothetical protein COY51_00470 [Candidatus Desantisbacteria bacterium CG_4_10_14_0_8_um_filter_39_17]